MSDDVHELLADGVPLRLLFEHSPDGIMLIDPAHPSGMWTIIECNQAACAMHGYSRDELLGQPLDLLNVYPAPVIPSDYLAYLDLLRREGPFQGHSTHRRRDGSHFPVEYSTALLTIDGRELVLGIDRDVTKRKQQEALQAQEAQFRLLFEYSPDAILLIDPSDSGENWLITACNEVAGRLYGFAESALIGCSVAALGWAEATPTTAGARLAALHETGTCVDETLYRHQAGHTVTIERSLVLVPQEQRRLILATLRDITAQQRAEQRLQFLAEASTVLTASLDYETTLAALVQLVVPGLADWCSINLRNAEGALKRVAARHVDPKKERMLTELRERQPPDLHRPTLSATPFPTDRGVLLSMQDEQALARVAQTPEQAEVYRKVGLHDAMIVPLRIGERLLGMLILATGESGRRYTTADLRLAEDLAQRAALAIENARLYQDAQAAVQLRDEFLQVAAHELKTPVTALVGYAEVLQRRALQSGSERDRRAFHVLAKQSSRLASLIEMLLDISRIQLGTFALQRQPLDLRSTVEHVAEETGASLHEAGDYHRLDYSCPDQAVVVDGDALRLEQVLVNLLQNAIKYSPAGGPIELGLERQGGEAVLSVRDQGMGIPVEALPHLFQRFYRASNVAGLQISGMGIGLYVAREVVSLHGGTIEVASSEGEGSTFTVRLPISGRSGPMS